MTDTLRWLEELPPGAPERELLVAGKNARPPAGAADAEWQALCVALTATAGVSGAATTGVAVSVTTAKSTSMVVASKATAVTSWLVGAKWFVAGAALGCGVAGASAVAQHVSRSAAGRADVPPATLARTPAPPRVRSPQRAAVPTPSATEAPDVVAEPAPSEPPRPAHSGARVDVAVRGEPPVASVPAAASAEFPAPLAPTTAPIAAATAPLAEQARELAEVKRLIDGGSATEALRRLEATRRAGAPFALSEERDALYVQALEKAGRRGDARLVARDFLLRYPRSPYLETMRRLLAAE